VLDFDTVLPGHGQAFKGKAKLDHWQAYVRDFWAQAQAFHKKGVRCEGAAKQVDLRGNAVNYPAIKAAGIVPNHSTPAIGPRRPETAERTSAPDSFEV
jgi:hypothetical protein